MKVTVKDRKDDQTLLCHVSWDSEGAMLRIVVPVECSVDEYSSPIQHGDDFILQDAPNKLPEHIQKRAIEEAQKLAQRFSSIPV